MEIFGRKNQNGTIDILHTEDGEPVTRISGCHTIYPINSSLSCDWEHPDGITLSMEDAKALGIEVE